MFPVLQVNCNQIEFRWLTFRGEGCGMEQVIEVRLTNKTNMKLKGDTSEGSVADATDGMCQLQWTVNVYT